MADNSEFLKSMSDATLKTVNDMEKKVKRACMVVENQAKQD